MKESIDLTENRAFRNNTQNLLNKKSYQRKRTPWKKAKPDELAESSSGYELSSTLYTSTNSSTWIDNSTSIDDWFGYNDLSLSSTTNTINLSWLNSPYLRDNSSMSNFLVKYYGNGSITISSSESYTDFSVFPTGRRDHVKLHRLPENNKKYQTEFKKCRCGEKISKAPWNDKYKCKQCVEKEEAQKESKYKEMSFMHEYFKKKNRYCSDVIPVPCLSRDIPMQEEKKIPKRYKEWDYYNDEFISEYIYDLFGRNKDRRRKKCVYYKGRELQIREEPWQPKGRVPQEYDELFDSTDWRDMLKKRIGNLERGVLFEKSDTEKESGINMNTVQFNISNDSWINFSIG